MTPPAWRAVAACRHIDPAVFFPSRDDDFQLEGALEVCGRCAVRASCLQAGLDEPFGVWGGTTEEERREMRRARRLAARRPVPVVPEIDLRSVQPH